VQFSNKSHIEPHAVVAEVGPKKAAPGLPEPRDPAEDDKLFDIDQLRASVSFVMEADDTTRPPPSELRIVFGAA
jgi:hypothetical protein